MQIPAGGPGIEPLNESLRAATRATDLVKQILTFSRRKEHERRVIAITPIVFEVGKLLRAALPSSIEIRTSIAAGLPNILADASQIHQVLMNLGTNAAHAMRKQGGAIEIAVRTLVVKRIAPRAIAGLNPGTYLRMTIRDTGEGMSRETLQRIFEPFFTTKPAGEGTGLGLSVVHGIVKAHDGSISVASQPGMGTCFDVYFPAVDEGAINVNGAREVPMGNGEKVLYVDDEMALCRLVEHSLARCGYCGVTRDDPVEALRVFMEDPSGFAAVITDFTMPKMSGLELTMEIRKVSVKIPAIITTGFTGSLDLEPIKLSGVTEVLPKPFTMQRLAECLREALARA
jgi:CheY-like chemotaxis protein